MDIVTIVLLLAACIAGYLKIKRIQNDINIISEENATVKTDFKLLQKEFNTLKGQMFIQEGILLQEKGKWCLEFDGAKKYFTPGKIENVESGDYTSEFIHSEETITNIVRQNGVVISEIVYKSNGSPLSGKVYQNGVAIKQFEYDEFGQVSKEENL